jgi:hypothetical protein
VPNLDLVEGHIEIHGDQAAGYRLDLVLAAAAARVAGQGELAMISVLATAGRRRS